MVNEWSGSNHKLTLPWNLHNKVLTLTAEEEEPQVHSRQRFMDDAALVGAGQPSWVSCSPRGCRAALVGVVQPSWVSGSPRGCRAALVGVVQPSWVSCSPRGCRAALVGVVQPSWVSCSPRGCQAALVGVVQPSWVYHTAHLSLLRPRNSQSLMTIDRKSSPDMFTVGQTHTKSGQTGGSPLGNQHIAAPFHTEMQTLNDRLQN